MCPTTAPTRKFIPLRSNDPLDSNIRLTGVASCLDMCPRYVGGTQKDHEKVERVVEIDRKRVEGKKSRKKEGTFD